MVCAALLLFVAAAPASDPRLAESRQLVEELEYEQARELLLEVLTDPALTDEDRFAANMQAGRVQRILNRDVEARLHFREALKIDPAADLPAGEPPKIKAFFDLVKREYLEDRPVAAAPAAPDPVPAAPAPVDPQPAAASSSFPWLTAGGLTAAAGALALALCAAAAGSMYMGLVYPTHDPDVRNIGRVGVWAALGGVAMSSAALGVGGGLVVVGLLAE